MPPMPTTKQLDLVKAFVFASVGQFPGYSPLRGFDHLEYRFSLGKASLPRVSRIFI